MINPTRDPQMASSTVARRHTLVLCGSGQYNRHWSSCDDNLAIFRKKLHQIHRGKLAMKILSLSTDQELSLFRKRILELAAMMCFR